MAERFIFALWQLVLYYTGDVQPPEDSHYVKDGKAIRDSEFAIGPATGRDWFDADRSILDIEKGPCTSSFVSPSHIR
jgi:hypothetical protein